MNICFVSPNVNVYSETFIINLKNGLQGKVFHCHNGQVPTQCEGVNLAGSHSMLDRIWKRMGIIKYSLTEHYFYSFLKRNRIVVIVANYGTCGAYIAPIAAALKIPLIVNFYGFDASVYSVLEKYRKSYQEMFRTARTIVVVSDEMKDALIKLGAPAEKIHTITCVPSSMFAAIQPDYESSQILGIGRFVDKKAPYLSILAFRIAVERYPHLRLKMVGDGPLWQVCKDLVSALNIPNVEFVGVLKPDQIAVVFEQSFCFIQHSKIAPDGDKEGMPVAILDAMSARLAIISTYHAGIPEIVRDGVNGFLVKEGDVAAMAERMIELSLDRELAEKLGKGGRETIQSGYTAEGYFARWNNLISSLAAKES